MAWPSHMLIHKAAASGHSAGAQCPLDGMEGAEVPGPSGCPPAPGPSPFVTKELDPAWQGLGFVLHYNKDFATAWLCPDRVSRPCQSREWFSHPLF